MSLAFQTAYYYLRCDEPSCSSEIWADGDTPKTKASLLRTARSWGWEIPRKGVGPHYCPDCQNENELVIISSEED